MHNIKIIALVHVVSDYVYAGSNEFRTVQKSAQFHLFTLDMHAGTNPKPLSGQS